MHCRLSVKTARMVKRNTLALMLLSLMSINGHAADHLTVAGYNTVSIDRILELQAAATQLHERGQLDEALAIYNELFLAVRLKSGLFTEEQLLVLDRLLAVNIDRSDWDSLNQQLSYHEWLSNRLFGNNPVALAQQLQVNSLHRQQAASRLQGPKRSWHLVQARTQLWRAVSALESLPEESDRLPNLWLQIANLHLELNNDGQRWLTSFENRTNEPHMISGWALRGNEVEQRSHEIGSELLQKISMHYSTRQHPPSIDRYALEAQLIALQGDWELLFDRPRHALHFYQQALKVAADSSCPSELRDVLFGQAIGLPLTELNIEDSNCAQIRLKYAEVLHGLISGQTDSKLYRPHWEHLE